MAAITLILMISSFFLNIIVTSNSAPISADITNLLKFRDSIKDDNGMLSNWSSSMSPCFGEKSNWIGITCSRAGNVWELSLENMGLSGSINVDHLVELTRLRAIDFMNNNFSGAMPNFKKLIDLQFIVLSNNKFEGTIDPNAFEGMRRLRKIDLAFNKFSGEIPKSLSTLQKLEELRLEGNQFQGNIPDIKIESMHIFNVSNNQLNGTIPSAFAKFDSSSFEGNKELCGSPLKSTCSLPPSNSKTISASPPPPEQTPEKPIPIVAILTGLVVIIVLAVLIIFMIRNKNKENNIHTENVPNRKTGALKNTTSVKNGSIGKCNNNSDKSNVVIEDDKLTFLDENRPKKFDLPDLLKAGAEILGSGCFGSSYKTTLSNGVVVVVKRFKQMNNVSKEEFQDHMRRLGKLSSHPNLLPLVAYYYKKKEKLFISDAFQKGSLGDLLHGRQVKGKTILDWATRLKVIKGVSKGLLELYIQLPSLVAPHGHLKSSNVLLTNTFDPVLSDYGLIPLINQESAHSFMVAYKSPEYFNHNRISKKTDVWALGILILEILTGEYPAGFLQQGKDVDMSSWVDSISHGEFDDNMGDLKRSHCEGEMQKLRGIGIACCEVNVEKRLDIKEACKKIEQVQERDDNSNSKNGGDA